MKAATAAAAAAAWAAGSDVAIADMQERKGSSFVEVDENTVPRRRKGIDCEWRTAMIRIL